MSHATVRPYTRPKIKDPSQDPVISMSRSRREKELKNEQTSREMSGVSGALLHRMHELRQVQQDIKELDEGVQEYQAQIDLLIERKARLQKTLAKHNDWCSTFDCMIGPFEQKYEDCKAEVKISFDHAKRKYKESLQKLIDDFGFHPTYKRWFDEF
ncbi:hypothetical protein AB1Y20_003712 [Prymnesium parvum]|uniref:Biogenesis of lysosome-related organelles complex 1 subunit 5 n=1 Tax=Prymnesium parvum TaxID=97485 RepID=A0AB34J5H0_PRYPA